MPTVTVTGSTGFLGAHVVLKFLEAGYTVRAVLRDESKIARVKAMPELKPYLSQLEFHAVPQFDDPTLPALKKAFEGTDAVVNTAAPLPSPQKTFQEIEKESSGIILSLIKVAAETSSIKTFVHVSTMGTAYHMRTPPWEQVDYVYDENSQFDYTSEELCKLSDEKAESNGWYPAAGLYYFGAKTTAEKETIKLAKQLDIQFNLTFLNPDIIFGPPIHPITEVKSNGFSMTAFTQFTKGPDAPVPDRTRLPTCTDVRDIAEASVLAVEKNTEGRFLLSGSKYDFQQLLDIIREKFPDQTKRLPVGNPGKYAQTYSMDTTKAKTVLGVKYHTLEQTVVDQFAKLLELESKGIPLV